MQSNLFPIRAKEFRISINDAFKKTMLTRFTRAKRLVSNCVKKMLFNRLYDYSERVYVLFLMLFARVKYMHALFAHAGDSTLQVKKKTIKLYT